jgi:ABC-2 type transport system ATP-binding protein
VFVSSHILAEIESTCDRVAILARGRLVTHGTVEEVISTAGHRSSVLVKVDDLDLGMWALRDAHLVANRVNDVLRVDVPPERAGDVTRILAAAGQWVTELRPDRFSLEDVFLELTSSHAEVSEPDLVEVGA